MSIGLSIPLTPLFPPVSILTMINPFIQHEGRVYLIEGWEPEMKGDRTLVIRPLTVKEMVIWRSNWEEFGFETYAQIVVRPDGKSRSTGKRKK